MRLDNEIMALLKNRPLLTISQIGDALPDWSRSWVWVVLRRLVASRHVTSSGDRGSRLYSATKKKFTPSMTNVEKMLLAIDLLGGAPSFRVLREHLGMSANLASATVVAASRAGLIEISGVKRKYTYSRVGNPVAPAKFSGVSSVFELGRMQ